MIKISFDSVNNYLNTDKIRQQKINNYCINNFIIITFGIILLEKLRYGKL